MQVQRALCAVSTLHPQKLTPCIDALYEALWVKGAGAPMEKPEGFGPILEQVLGRDAGTEVIQKVSFLSSCVSSYSSSKLL